MEDICISTYKKVMSFIIWNFLKYKTVVILQSCHFSRMINWMNYVYGTSFDLKEKSLTTLENDKIS